MTRLTILISLHLFSAILGSAYAQKIEELEITCVPKGNKITIQSMSSDTVNNYLYVAYYYCNELEQYNYEIAKYDNKAWTVISSFYPYNKINGVIQRFSMNEQYASIYGVAQMIVLNGRLFVSGTMRIKNDTITIDDSFADSNYGVNGRGTNLLEFNGKKWTQFPEIFPKHAWGKILDYKNELYAVAYDYLNAEKAENGNLFKWNGNTWVTPGEPIKIDFYTFNDGDGTRTFQFSNGVYQNELYLLADKLRKYDGEKWTDVLLPEKGKAVQLFAFNNKLIVYGIFLNDEQKKEECFLIYNGRGFDYLFGGKDLKYFYASDFNMNNHLHEEWKNWFIQKIKIFPLNTDEFLVLAPAGIRVDNDYFSLVRCNDMGIVSGITTVDMPHMLIDYNVNNTLHSRKSYNLIGPGNGIYFDNKFYFACIKDEAKSTKGYKVKNSGKIFSPVTIWQITMYPNKIYCINGIDKTK